MLFHCYPCCPYESSVRYRHPGVFNSFVDLFSRRPLYRPNVYVPPRMGRYDVGRPLQGNRVVVGNPDRFSMPQFRTATAPQAGVRIPAGIRAR